MVCSTYIRTSICSKLLMIQFSRYVSEQCESNRWTSTQAPSIGEFLLAKLHDDQRLTLVGELGAGSQECNVGRPLSLRGGSTTWTYNMYREHNWFCMTRSVSKGRAALWLRYILRLSSGPELWRTTRTDSYNQTNHAETEKFYFHV